MLFELALWMRQHDSSFGVWPERLEDLDSRLIRFRLRIWEYLYDRTEV